MLPISVIVTVYHRIAPDAFAQSIESVLDQSRPAAEILVVADGPLTPALDDVIASIDDDRVRVIRLPENRGLAVASQTGLRAATQPWAAKQDADDISLRNRFELVEPYLRDDLAAIGGAMLEFEGQPDNVVGIRRLPERHDDIVRAARFNTPMNHPTLVLNVQRALAVGGYQSVPFLEDYDLYARLIMRDERLHNIPEPLVLFRSDPAMFERRRDRRLFAAEARMQRRLVKYGLISWPRAGANFLLRCGVRLLPAPAFRSLHRWVFRRPASKLGRAALPVPKPVPSGEPEAK